MYFCCSVRMDRNCVCQNKSINTNENPLRPWMKNVHIIEHIKTKQKKFQVWESNRHCQLLSAGRAAITTKQQKKETIKCQNIHSKKKNKNIIASIKGKLTVISWYTTEQQTPSNKNNDITQCGHKEDVFMSHEADFRLQYPGWLRGRTSVYL